MAAGSLQLRAALLAAAALCCLCLSGSAVAAASASHARRPHHLSLHQHNHHYRYRRPRHQHHHNTAVAAADEYTSSSGGDGEGSFNDYSSTSPGEDSTNGRVVTTAERQEQQQVSRGMPQQQQQQQTSRSMTQPQAVAGQSASSSSVPFTSTSDIETAPAAPPAPPRAEAAAAAPVFTTPRLDSNVQQPPVRAAAFNRGDDSTSSGSTSRANSRTNNNSRSPGRDDSSTNSTNRSLNRGESSTSRIITSGVTSRTPYLSLFRYVCPAEFLRLGNGCYYFSKRMAAWQEAHFDCRARHSQLAAINSAWEDSILKSHLNRPAMTRLNRWLGGMFDWSRDEWVWGSSGAVMSYRGFLQTSPHSPNSPRWQCAYAAPSLYYRWTYTKCTEVMHYICEAPFSRVSRQL